MPLVRRTRAIFRKAEFGFFGVIVRTTVHTPRFCRFRSVFNVNRSAGALVFFVCCLRPLRINWLIVGTEFLQVVGSLGSQAPCYPYSFLDKTMPFRKGNPQTIERFAREG